MVIVVIFLFKEKKSISSKPIIKPLSFLLDYVYGVYLKNLIEMNPKKYLSKEMCTIFQLIIMSY